jgi:ATP-binding cassette subfamily C protein LapB
LSLVDRILLFDQGKLVADGPRDKVIAMLRGEPKPAKGPALATAATAGVKVSASV